MKNLLSTIPKAKFTSWDHARRVVERCDGTTDWGNGEWFWVLNCRNLPTQSGVGAQCFMIYDGMVRGYFYVVDVRSSPQGKSLILANWYPISPVPHTGFQGYRYTELWG